MKEFDLIVVGHLLKEKIIFSDGREIGPVLGSPAAYTSIASAKLGLKVGLVSNIGKDMPEELLKVFKETGVDTEGIRIGDNTTTNLLIYEKVGKKRLKFLKKADDISFNDIPEKYFNAKFFLICPIDYEVGENLIVKLHQKGKRLSMELSGFGGASSGKNEKTKKEKIEFLKRITKYFEIVKGGKEDCNCLFGNLDEKNILKNFLEWGAKISIITLREKGAIIGIKDGKSSMKIFEIPSFPAKAIDVTGAGDVWHAGFLYQYISSLISGNRKKELIYNAGIFASALSSFLIEKTGGVKKERFPTCQQVEKKIKEKNEF